MKITTPKDIVLISSNIATDSDGYSEYSSISTYAVNSYVILTKEIDGITERFPHKIYKSLQNGNTGKYPPDNLSWWQDEGGTNRYKMFDEFIDTQTVNPNSIDVVVNAFNCDKLALFNLDAIEIEITLTDMDFSTVVLSEIFDLSLGGGEYKKDIVVPLLVYPNAQLRVQIKNPSSNAKAGIIIIGYSEEIGTTQFGIKPGIIDYSIKSTNDYGQTILSVGAWAKDLDLEFQLEPWQLDFVYDILVEARGKNILIECNENGTDYEMLNLYGFFKSWKINLKNNVIFFGSANYQGVI